ncbi:MAG: DNA polymerase III subunit delta [SAR202 cluster bacterium]|nr:DNA polymerase III subunit delta [SAR202 cluster bacterium]
MIVLLYGEDEVGVEETLAKMKEATGPEDLRDVNVTVLMGSDLTPENLAMAAFTLPFMTDRRLVVVKGLLTRFQGQGPSRGGARRKELEPWSALIDQLETLPDVTGLVFVDAALVKNNPMLAKLKSVAREQEHALPRGSAFQGWVAQRAKTRGVDIEPAAIAALTDAVGRQPRLVDVELQKLGAYKEGGRVTRDDVQRMVAYVREAGIFEAVDAVVEGRTGDAIRMVRQIVEGGDPAVYVITMIARQVRLLLLAKDLRANNVQRNEMPQRLGVPPFAVDRTLRQEGRLSFPRLREIHHRLVETDLAMKSTSIDDELALEMLIAELSLV